jgi:hypothetical protein
VYDMYRWGQPAGTAESGGDGSQQRPGRSRRRLAAATAAARGRAAGPAAGRAERAAQAVQAALDRRDNGGDTAAPGDQ